MNLDALGECATIDSMEADEQLLDEPPARCGRPLAHPALKRINVPVRLPAWMVAFIDARGGTRAAVIEAALLKEYSLSSIGAEVKERAKWVP